jgi:CRISPR-associated protein Cas2
MRIFVFFDLPTDTAEDLKNYRIFRKNLFKLGYTMMQYSIYQKSINVQTKREREEKKIISILPKYGDVRFMCVTEHQYQDIKILRGEKSIVEKVNDEKTYIKL